MPAKFDRCVKDVQAKGKATNAYAVCRSTLGTDADIRAGRKPTRHPTRGRSR